MRDTGRAKVYAAEVIVASVFDIVAASGTRTRMPVQVAGSTLTLPDERRFADVASIQRYVAAIPGADDIKVRSRKGLTRAHYARAVGFTPEIAIPLSPPAGRRDMARELIVLHEVAHHLAPFTGHQRPWRDTFLELLAAHMGPEAALLMRVNFADQGL